MFGSLYSPGYYCQTGSDPKYFSFYGTSIADKSPSLTITYKIPTPTKNVFQTFWEILKEYWPLIVGIPTSVLIVVIGYMYEKWFPTRKSSYYKQDV